MKGYLGDMLRVHRGMQGYRGGLDGQVWVAPWQAEGQARAPAPREVLAAVAASCSARSKDMTPLSSRPWRRTPR